MGSKMRLRAEPSLSTSFVYLTFLVLSRESEPSSGVGVRGEPTRRLRSGQGRPRGGQRPDRRPASRGWEGTDRREGRGTPVQRPRRRGGLDPRARKPTPDGAAGPSDGSRSDSGALEPLRVGAPGAGSPVSRHHRARPLAPAPRDTRPQPAGWRCRSARPGDPRAPGCSKWALPRPSKLNVAISPLTSRAQRAFTDSWGPRSERIHSRIWRAARSGSCSQANTSTLALNPPACSTGRVSVSTCTSWSPRRRVGNSIRCMEHLFASAASAACNCLGRVCVKRSSRGERRR